MLNEYVDLAKAEPKMTFVGRLGTYRYLDMDVTIREALEVADQYRDLMSKGQTEQMPAFALDPLV